MNLDKLKTLFNESPGKLVVKNYKVMCEILGVEHKKDGKGVKYHKKDMARYFRYEQDGQKMIVKEIYDMELEKINNIGCTGKFTDDLQDIMLNVLSQDTKGELLFSKNILLKSLNMINENYRVARYNIPKLSELIEVDEQTIYDFYNENKDKMIDYVETALKRLRSRRLIIWEKVMIVAEVIPEENEFGQPKLNLYDDTKDSATVKTRLNYRQATQEEKQMILAIEKSVLASLGFKNIQALVMGGMWNTYKKRVTHRVREKFNIKFHFEGYLITYNHSDVIQSIEEENVINRKVTVNNNLVKSLKGNAITRHTNSKDKQKKIDEHKELLDLYTREELKAKGIKGYRMNTRDKVAIKDNFIVDTSKIVDTVISQLAFDLTKELVEEPTKKTTKEVKNDSNLPF